MTQELYIFFGAGYFASGLWFAREAYRKRVSFGNTMMAGVYLTVAVYLLTRAFS